jgi:hypothetical protein
VCCLADADGCGGLQEQTTGIVDVVITRCKLEQHGSCACLRAQVVVAGWPGASAKR